MGAGPGPRLPDGQEPTQEAVEKGRGYPAREPEACGAGRVVEQIVTFPVRRDWTVNSSSKGLCRGWECGVLIHSGSGPEEAASFRI